MAAVVTVVSMQDTRAVPERGDQAEADEADRQPSAAVARGPLRKVLVLLLVLALVGGWIFAAADDAADDAEVVDPPRSGPPITVHAWAPYWQPDSALASFTSNSALFSDVSLFAYHAAAADAVGAYAQADLDLIQQFEGPAATAGVKLTASIIDDTGPGGMAAILADPVSRQLHVETIVEFTSASGFDGIDLDYETFAFGDERQTWAETRPNWVAFVTDLAEALHARDKTLTVSVPPQYDPERTGGDRGYWVYDYEAIGQVVDFVRIMAYDYSTSDPGAIAPIDWVEGLVNDIKDLVPPSKMILGVPVYGYNWPTSTLGLCPAGQEPKRRSQSTTSATALAASVGVVPTYDESRAESTFVYNETLIGLDLDGAETTCTVTRTVWFADARAVHRRALLAHREGLAGISIWSLGSDDPASWSAISAAKAGQETWQPVPQP